VRGPVMPLPVVRVEERVKAIVFLGLIKEVEVDG